MDFFVCRVSWSTNENDVPYFYPYMDYGTILNNIERASWVERYNEPGEFSIEAKKSSGILELAPVGSFISHILSRDFMIVENHEIIHEKDKEPTIKISGRSILSILEQRQVGSQPAAGSTLINPDNYEDFLEANDTWKQIALLMDHHMYGLISPDWVPKDYTQCWHSGDEMFPQTYADDRYDLEGNPLHGEQVDRVIERGPLLDRVLELLAIDDLGVRFDRWGISSQNGFTVHWGDENTGVVFSWDNGDFDHLEYLYSNKSYKTAALVVGSKIWVNVDGTPEITHYGLSRRTAICDGSDIDGFLTAAPTTTQRNQIVAKMTTRGHEFIRKQIYTNITRVEISSDSKYRYRSDYQIGDIVKIETDDGTLVKMRVIEHAETLDENGITNIPTLVPFERERLPPS